MLTLAGKTALVTGSSRGIGRAIALLFGELGARVAVHYRTDADAAGEVVQALGAAGHDAVAIGADLHAVAAGEALVAQAEERLGPLDVVVINHAIWKRAPLEAMSPEQWEETLRVNLTGAWTVCRESARRMRARRAGCIVTVSSTAGQRGEPQYAHYAASKGGLIALTRSLAAELAPYGIRVNGVAPGWVLTDMTRDVLEGEQAADAVGAIPLGRPGRPEEIAGPVAFLASDLASYVYGEVLCVNGGAVMVSY